jgi:ABC-2 type transport system permease protein
MNSAIAIAKKELNVYFTTPVAYVAFMVMAFFAAQFFTGSVEAYRTFAARMSPFEGQQLMERLNLTDVVVSRLFASVGIFIIISAPFLSMRLVAEEKRGRTFELLMTSPVRPFEIVLGKYLAALAVMAVSIAIVALFPALLAFVRRARAAVRPSSGRPSRRGSSACSCSARWPWRWASSSRRSPSPSSWRRSSRSSCCSRCGW